MRTTPTILAAIVSAFLIATSCKQDAQSSGTGGSNIGTSPDPKATPAEPAAKPAPAPGAADAKPAPAPSATPNPAAGAPSAAAPKRIKVAHVLIAFQGTGLPGVTRSKAEAEKLAGEVFERAKKGEDFDALMKMSDDRPPSPGKYGMALDNASKKDPTDMLRTQMVPAFGDVGFTLQVGEVGLAPFDPQKSPYGWHIIKRIE